MTTAAERVEPAFPLRSKGYPLERRSANADSVDLFPPKNILGGSHALNTSGRKSALVTAPSVAASIAAAYSAGTLLSRRSQFHTFDCDALMRRARAV